MPFPNEVAALAALSERVSRGLADLTHDPGRERRRAEPVDEMADHVRGARGGHLLIEYGDYECPYSRAAYRAVQRLARDLEFRFVFRHFPLTGIHSHALAAALAAEAASLQGRFWEMHDWLFHHQRTLADRDLRAAAVELGLDVARFDRDRARSSVLRRIRRDMESGLATGEVHGTPTVFLDGVVQRGGHDAATLRQALAS